MVISITLGAVETNGEIYIIFGLVLCCLVLACNFKLEPKTTDRI